MYVLLVAGQGREIDRLSAELTNQGLSCKLATGAESLLAQIDKELPDFLLVELFGTAEIDQIYRELKRENNSPIIALAQLETVDKINASIDDFVIKPYSAQEIIFRARRLMQKKNQITTGAQIKIGEISIDVENYEVYVHGRPVSLTFREYELLKCLADNPGRVFTREALLNKVWGQDYLGGDRTVDVHIRRLRSKIEDPEHVYIETARNIGYRLKKP